MTLTPPKTQNQAVDIPLEEFGGLITEMTPADIPMGASPYVQDMDFQLGSVFTRAGLTAKFSGLFTPASNCNYLKSFALPNTNDELLLLDGAGAFWYEDTTNNPNVLNAIGNVTAGSFANSDTQFGREWMAFNDGKWGFDAPRQWDGTNFDRVSQDGPGAAPSAVDEAAVFTITAGPTGATEGSFNILGSPTGLTQAGNVVTALFTVVPPATAIQIGDNIVVAGAGVAGYDGTFTVLSLVYTGTQIVGITYYNPTSGLAPSGGGTVSTFLATFTLSSSAYLPNGTVVTVAGVGVAGYNGTWTVRRITGELISSTTFNAIITTSGLAGSGAGTVTPTGNITAGIHKFVQIFQTRQGYLTAPSPIGQWTAAGAKRATITNLAIGPSNVIARWLAFTSSGGGFFFAIPIATTGSATGTIVPDNTSTIATVDFTDVTLLNSFSIDSPGNNLFNLDVLGPAAGVIAYANRMVWWGERNKIQNLLNMGFDGGFDPTNTYPLGWLPVAGTSAGAQANPGPIFGFGYTMTSGGGINPNRPWGNITQGASRDSFGVRILSPNTKYSVRVAAVLSGPSVTSGNLNIGIGSLSTGFNVNIAIPLSSLSNAASYVSGTFSLATPSIIPDDMEFGVNSTIQPLNAQVTIDELEIFPTNEPYISTDLRVSYNSNPESFDGVTGLIGVSNLDGKTIRACFLLRDTLYIVKEGSLYVTQDNGSTEPYGWTVSTISNVIGTPSLRGVAVAEEYAFIVNQLGVYMFNGSEPIRVNQEIKPVSGLGQGWDTINWKYGHTIWTVLDTNNRHLLIGAPVGASTTPNQIFMMNYRELDESYAVASQKAVHMSYTGKMVSWDMSRKWGQWNISANCCATVRRQDKTLQVWFGNNQSNGKAYYLDPANTTDDGLAIGGGDCAYFSFFFVNREMEQGLQLGSHLHIFTYLAYFASGSGILSPSLYADSLTTTRIKPLAPRTLSTNPLWDRETGVNFRAERAAIKFATDGQPGSVFALAKLTMSMKSDPWVPVRGVA